MTARKETMTAVLAATTTGAAAASASFQMPRCAAYNIGSDSAAAAVIRTYVYVYIYTYIHTSTYASKYVEFVSSICLHVAFQKIFAAFAFEKRRQIF